MKKLLVLLTACAVMCAFGSCGKKEENSVSESSLVSESGETETTAEEVSGDETESATTEENNIEQVPVEILAQPETHEYIEDADKTPFVGKWECSKLAANGEELTELKGIPAYAVFQYDIMEDGTVALAESLMEIADPEDMVDYTWGVVSETEIEIVGSNDSAILFTLKNGQLVNIDDSEEIYLDKVDEFQDFDFKTYYEELMSQQDNYEYVLTPVETDADGNIIGESTETIVVG